MYRIRLLLVVLIATGCSRDSEDVADVPVENGVDVTPAPAPVEPEPILDEASEPPRDAEDVTTPVAPADLDELLAGYLETRDGETWLALREQVIASESYQPYSDEFTGAEEFLDLYQLDEARAALEETMPNLLLSPRAHRLLAEIESADNNVPAAEEERSIADACVEGLLSTGDGSEQRPWLVLRTSDEYDVLAHLGKRPEMQSLVSRDGRSFDLVSCTDDTEVWFDVTDALERLGRSLQ